MTKQEYIKQVAKYLKCTPEKRSEIERQLASDIDIALSEGRQLEEILDQMGGPEALAEEFNENLGEGTGNVKRKSRLPLLLLLALLALLVGIVVLAYWMLPKQRDINSSKSFDTSELQTRTEEIIQVFSAGDYETLNGYMGEVLLESIGEFDLENAKLLISGDWGALQNTGAIYMSEIRQRGVDYALVQMNASYDNVSVTFTLTFDTQLQLIGFYMR